MTPGMRAIADFGGLHMDLAARNVLVAADMTCKVSDFGLFRDHVYYQMHRKKIVPVRWSAPEVLNLEKVLLLLLLLLLCVVLCVCVCAHMRVHCTPIASPHCTGLPSWRLTRVCFGPVLVRE